MDRINPYQSFTSDTARENIAYSYSEEKIHREVMVNICSLQGVDDLMKIELMMQSIKDVAVIFFILKHFNRIGRLTDKEYAKYLKIITAKLYRDEKEVEFDPRKLRNASY